MRPVRVDLHVPRKPEFQQVTGLEPPLRHPTTSRRAERDRMFPADVPVPTRRACPLTQKVLIVEDEPAIATLVDYNLRRAGFRTEIASEGRTALELASAEPPDLVILDIMLPDADGRDVCRELRRRSDVPVIFLTARDAEVDRIVGLEIGADDYVTKPFSPGELVARVRAVLRRARAGPGASAAAGGPGSAGSAASGTLRVGDLYLDRARHEARRTGRDLNLTPTEFALLECFMSHPGIVLSREQLLDMVWGLDYFGDPRLVDVHIRHLREKVEDDPANPRFIVTIRGAGYKLREA